jgi:hypothetical protein
MLFRLTLALLSLSVLSVASAQTPPAELLKSLPGPFNTATVINVESILASPRAKKDSWDKITETSYIAGAIPIHPSMQRIVTATELAPGKGRGEMMAVVPMKAAVNLEKIGSGLHGQSVNIGGDNVIATPNGNYLVKLEDNLLGLMRTTHRQDVSRWIKAKKDKTLPAPDKYLTNAVASWGNKNHILIAVDVDDLFDKADVVSAMAASPLTEQDKKSADAIVKFLGGLKGVRIIGTFSEAGTELRIVLDGTVPPSANPEIMREFVGELLERARVPLTDLRAAVAKNENENFSLTLKINDDELGFLMSLVLPPITQDLDATHNLTVLPGGANKAATTKYLATVNKTLDDLKKRTETGTDPFQTALWYDSAARNIEAMSILGVEKVAVEFAYGSCELLHAIGESFRGTPIKVATLQNDAYLFTDRQPALLWTPFYGLQWNPWMGQVNNVRTNLPEVRRKQIETVLKDAENRVKLWDKIVTKQSAVRNAIGK